MPCIPLLVPLEAIARCLAFAPRPARRLRDPARPTGPSNTKAAVPCGRLALCAPSQVTEVAERREGAHSASRARAYPHSLYPHTMHFTHPSAKFSSDAQSGHVPMKVSPGS
jgi:hypothetical protein